MIDEGVVTRVLSEALKTGGEFAEVFVEDRRGSTLGLDDGRVEDISSGRERGAGIRVVAGNTTGFAHTADLSERGLLKAAEAASGAARSGGGGAREVALSRRRPESPSPVDVLPAGVGKDGKWSYCSGPTPLPGPPGARCARSRPSTATAAGRYWWPAPRACLASDDQVRAQFRVSAVASGDTGMQTGAESVGATMGFELFDLYDVEELGRSAGASVPAQTSGETSAVGDHARCHQMR